ncbi:MAG: hypothetical protein IH623_14465 [Verrucomicrobia bacterium]|nr:hypothetical protein [Verrucomicrobiota bacterium]
MPCEHPNKYQWCKGPDGTGPGRICTYCDKKRAGAAVSALKPVVPVKQIKPAVPATSAKPAPSVAQGPPTPTADNPWRISLRKTAANTAPKAKRTRGETITKDHVPAEHEFTAYRGDSRDPDDIFKMGFQTWVTKIFTVEDARDYMRYYVGLKTKEELSFKKHVDTGAVEILPQTKGAKLGPNDLMRNIIAARNKKRPTISTDTNPACGGYGEEGFIYRMHIPDLKKRDWVQAFGGDAGLKPQAVWPDLYLNRPTIDDATCIALFNEIGNATTELSFLTDIPPQWIIQAYVT